MWSLLVGKGRELSVSTPRHWAEVRRHSSLEQVQMFRGETMIDDATLDKIRKALPQHLFRTGDLALELRIDKRKLAFMLGILQRLGEVRRVEMRVVLSAGFKTTRSFWRKTA